MARSAVLVVEDDPLLRYAIAEALQRDGWRVLEAGSAEDAIDYCNENERIAVVFTDIQLAGELSGWDVAEAFRARQPDVSVIYTSGNSTDRRRQVAGADFFSKPYDTARVVEVCRRYVSAGEAQSGPEQTKVMAHLFLHIVNGRERTEDIEGADYADLAAAKAEAVESARELVSQAALRGQALGLNRTVEIMNEAGAVVGRIAFTDAFAAD